MSNEPEHTQTNAPELTAVSVLMNLSLDKTFDYLIPPRLQGQIVPGMKVNVLFGNSRKPRQAHVVKLIPAPERDDLKEILSICDEQPVIPDSLSRLGTWIADYYCCTKEQALRALLPAAVRSGKVKSRKERAYYLASPEEAANYLEKLGKRSPARAAAIQTLLLHPGASPELLGALTGITSAQLGALVKSGVLTMAEHNVDRDPFRNATILQTTPLPLTGDQGAALDRIRQMLDHRSEHDPHVLLLHGVTCSGKTEVYLQAIAHVLEQGGDAIVLVPEISLTPQTVTRFRGRFGEQVSVLHSGLTDGERHDEWMKVHRGTVRIAVGARSALFAPFRNLKLIIVDEEHDSSYKQSEAPRYHARDVAVVRGQMEHALVILGSATPSLETWHNAETGKYALASMPKRWDPDIVLPNVEIVDMRLEIKEDQRMPTFSKMLIDAVHSRLTRGEQCILFLNKRGYSRQLECTACGYIPSCSECSMTYTYHKHSESMICHLCGAAVRAFTVCPQCGGTELKYKGFGTEKIEILSQKLFPSARIARMDSDTMTKPGLYEKVLSSFRRGDLDILIGTQMIAKGLDFPNVTLVGVINADMGLFSPDFRAHERTFQLLAQVAGRAGRGVVPGQVIVQTVVPDNPAILCAKHHSCEDFFAEEMPIRKELALPPFAHFSILHFEGDDMLEIQTHAQELLDRIQNHFPQLEISPLAPAPYERIKGKYRYMAALRIARPKASFRKYLREEAMAWRKNVKRVEFYVDVDALSML